MDSNTRLEKMIIKLFTNETLSLITQTIDT